MEEEWKDVRGVEVAHARRALAQKRKRKFAFWSSSPCCALCRKERKMLAGSITWPGRRFWGWAGVLGESQAMAGATCLVGGSLLLNSAGMKSSTARRCVWYGSRYVHGRPARSHASVHSRSIDLAA